MKKLSLVIGFFIFSGVIGCKDQETGLQKKVLNTAMNDCVTRLHDSLKSPSSLRVGEVLAATYMPKAKDVNRVASDLLIEKKTGQISEVLQRLKVRYRELGLSIQYEAQNSFGVYLKGKFNCEYIYQLTSDKVSPEDDIWLSKLQNNNESVVANSIIELKNGSNLILDSKYSKIIGDVPAEQTPSDKELLNQVVEIWSTEKVFKDFSTGEMKDYAN